MGALDQVKLIVPLVTLDTENLRKLVRYVIDGGVDAIFILGKTGEFDILTEDARKKTIETVVSEVCGEVPVLVGAIGKTIDKTIEYVKDAENLGADIVVIAPGYNQPGKWRAKSNDKYLLGYVDKVLEKNPDTPIMLYNNPHLPNSANISINIVKELTEEGRMDKKERMDKNKRILGLKDSFGDKDYLWATINSCKSSNFKIYQGDESEILWALEHGAHGAVPSMANVYPEVCADLLRTGEERYQQEIIDLQESVYGKNFSPKDVPAGIKKELRKRKIIS